MRFLLLVLAFSYMLLVPVPVLAQVSQGGLSAAQYGSNDPGDGPAHSAALAALLASGALRGTAEEEQATQGNPASAAESSASPSEQEAAFSVNAQDESAVSPDNTQGESAVSPDKTQGESAVSPDLEKLPETGGPSSLWLFGAPAICIGGILARRIVLPWSKPE
jgi:hypothetical protein